jgi:hypothetical protein
VSENGEGWVGKLTQIAGLFAGLGAVVYATGAIVLTLRLAFQGLPVADVVSALPREFILSTGAGQVLLPSLLVGAVYGLYRLFWPRERKLPSAVRASEGKWADVLWRWTAIALLMLVPLLAVAFFRQEASLGHTSLYIWLGVAVVVVVTATATYEVRAILIRRYGYELVWDSPRVGAALASLYVAAAIPAVTIAAAGAPLSKAKACLTGGHWEGSYLIGQTASNIYLGESQPSDGGGDDHYEQGGPERGRRIAVIPAAEVDELFIGPDAASAACEPAGSSAETGAPAAAAK